MSTTRESLSAAIAAQERAVEEADNLLASHIGTVTRRVRSSPLPVRGIGITLGSVAASWLFRRGQRRVMTRAAGSGGRLPMLVNAALPLLVPAIGVHAATLLTALAATPQRRAPRLPAVAPLVDLDRFAGTWYEIGSTSGRGNRPEDVSTTYLVDGARLRVIHRRRRANGSFEVRRGEARVRDRVSWARLRLTFTPTLLRWLPGAWSDLWILDVTPDYSRALVGTPDRRSLRLLAREPSISAGEYQRLLLRAAAQGYETRRMRITAHRAVR
jgi:apolipoprotein D and lipocalin family protein